MPAESADLLIHDVTAVTVDSRRRIIADAAIAIHETKIADVGKAADLEGRYPAARRIQGRGMLAIPGLIDAHLHSPQTMLRSVADDVPWRPYLEDFIWPLQGMYEPGDAVASMRLTLLEMLKSGSTEQDIIPLLIAMMRDGDGLMIPVESMFTGAEAEIQLAEFRLGRGPFLEDDDE